MKYVTVIGEPPVNQTKTITTKTITTPDVGYDGIDRAVVNIPENKYYKIPLTVTDGSINRIINNISLPSYITDIGTKGLYSAFFYSTVTNPADFSYIETVTGAQGCREAFSYIKIPSITFSNLTSISGNNSFYRAFYYGTTDVSFPSLTTISGNQAFLEAFKYFKGNVYFPELQTITGTSVFSACFPTSNQIGPVFSKLSEISVDNTFADCEFNAAYSNPFPALEVISGNGTIKIRGNASNFFPKLKIVSGNNVFDNAFAGNSSMSTNPFDKVETASGYRCFYNTFGNKASFTEDIVFSELKEVTGEEAFSQLLNNHNTSSKNVNFPKLTKVTGYKAFTDFASHGYLNSVNFPELTEVGENSFSRAFASQSYIKSISFPKLEYITSASAFTSAFNSNYAITSFSFPNLKEVHAASALNNAYTDSTIAYVSLPSLISVSGNSCMSSMFNRASSLISLSLPNMDLSETSDGAFNSLCSECTKLTSADLSGLTNVKGYGAFSNAFYECTSLTSVNLSSLAELSGNQVIRQAFYDTKLSSISFPALTTIHGSNAFYGAFQQCSSLKHIYFNSLTTDFFSHTNIFDYMLDSAVSGCTVHFPKELQTVIGDWNSVLGGFGGTNTKTLFDL